MDQYKERVAELRAEWLKPGHKPLAMERAADAIEHLAGIIELAGKQEAVLFAEFAVDGGWLGDASEFPEILEEPIALYTHPDYASAARIKELERQNAMLLDALKKFAEYETLFEKGDDVAAMLAYEDLKNMAREAIESMKGGAA